MLDLVYYPQLSLNPLKSDNYVNKMVLSLVHMGLFGVDKNYEAVPLLCGSYAVSEDLMTYYFYLAPGATFSDGTAVTMNDVYASYQVAQETEMVSESVLPFFRYFRKRSRSFGSAAGHGF